MLSKFLFVASRWRCWHLGSVALVGLLIMTGCGPSVSNKNALETSLKLQTRADRFDFAPAPINAKPEQAYELLDSATTPADATEGFSALAAAGSLHDALASALCTGMQQLVQHTVRDGAPNWGEFLIAQMRVQEPRLSNARATTEVSRLLTVWNLLAVTPQRAEIYVEACGSEPLVP
jgi:hypothetical protein